eukprot:2117843-Rhodomonas_salina.1
MYCALASQPSPSPPKPQTPKTHNLTSETDTQAKKQKGAAQKLEGEWKELQARSLPTLSALSLSLVVSWSRGLVVSLSRGPA